MKKWGKYLPMVALLFPGGMFIVGAWLAVEFIRRGDDVAGDDEKKLGSTLQKAEGR